MKMVTEIRVEDGVHISDETLKAFTEFEAHYINIRNKEKRILTISEIQQLPYPDKTNLNYAEWQMRQKNCARFINYLQKKSNPLRILDIGCGNGFMTNLLAFNNNEVVGVDVNLTELKQASAAFPHKNITWYYLDILNQPLPEKKFDIITFCASFQYFKNAKQILDTCKNYLGASGEIHIIDSPFYDDQTKLKAEEHSKLYFNKMGVQQMVPHYNHHSFKVFDAYNIEIKYKPHSFLKRILNIKDSPFPWIKIV